MPLIIQLWMNLNRVHLGFTLVTNSVGNRALKVLDLPPLDLTHQELSTTLRMCARISLKVLVLILLNIQRKHYSMFQ
jgi:hypothetical protein